MVNRSRTNKTANSHAWNTAKGNQWNLHQEEKKNEPASFLFLSIKTKLTKIETLIPHLPLSKTIYKYHTSSQLFVINA